MTTEHELRISGRTRAITEDLKRAGYSWEPMTRSWTRRITAEMAETIRRGGDSAVDALRSVGGRRRGCVTHLCYPGTLGTEVYRSPTAPGRPDTHGPVPGLDYCDQPGNYVGGRRIDGSAADDLI